MTKEEEDVAIDDDYLDANLISLLDGTAEGKKLFYKFCKKWREFLDSLGKKDRTILLKMILDVSIYNEDISSMINIENSKSYNDLMFFLLTMILFQKKIDELNMHDTEKKDGHC